MLVKLANWLRGTRREPAAVVRLLNSARNAFSDGDLGRAMEEATEALTHSPRCAAALKLQGTILALRGERQAAIEAFESALREDGRDPETHINYGNVLRLAGRDDDADMAYRHAVLLNPGTVEAHNALGSLLLARKRNAEALKAFQRALDIADDARALAGLAGALVNLGRYPEAAAHLLPLYDQGRLAKSDRYILGVALTHSGDLDRGCEVLEAAHQDAPANSGVALSLGMAYLMAGRWREGFALYERRHDAQTLNEFGAVSPWLGYLKFVLADIPAWTGGSCEGKRLLIWGEQGLGDSLMMLRALPVLTRDWRAARITFLCAPALAPFGACFEDIEFLAPDPGWRASASDFDLQCSIMSLPHLMDITPDSIPGTTPYIRASQERRDSWRERAASLPGLRVGLVWAGGVNLQLDHLRSLSLAQVASLLDVDYVSFVSLQKDEAARAELRASGLPIADWMGDVKDFMDTAALVSHLDLVISVDTALAHLVGAMEQPVWMLNRFSSEWRWMRDREDSVWYPTMRIFSQTEPGDWDSVIRRVTGELKQLAASRGK